MSSRKTKNTVCTVGVSVGFALLVICELFRDNIFGNIPQGDALYAIASKLIAAVLAIFLVVYFDMTSFLKLNLRRNLRRIVFLLPCLLIAVNNFPFVPLLTGELVFDIEPTGLILFAAECLAVGLFEEIAYRACVFGIILKRRRTTTKDIFVSIILSSLVFGASHLINLAAGSDILPTILQTGYSFLIGAMCSYVLLESASVWPCVLIHAVYNFCGGIAPRFATGPIWTLGEITLTAVLSILVIVYVVVRLIKFDPKTTDNLFVL